MVNVLISLAVFFGISTSLIIIDGKPDLDMSLQNQLAFDELAIDYSDIPPLDTFLCRDGAYLDYRYYPSESDNALILLHGLSWLLRRPLPTQAGC